MKPPTKTRRGTPDLGPREREWVEEMGLLYEKMGQARIPGLIIGYLLICKPPHRTMREIQEALGISAGSVSTEVRKLESFGFLERAAKPGSRKKHYRIQEGALSRTMAGRMHFVGIMRRIAEKGLALLPARETSRGARLREMHEFYAFMERELPRLFQRWEQETSRRKG